MDGGYHIRFPNSATSMCVQNREVVEPFDHTPEYSSVKGEVNLRQVAQDLRRDLRRVEKFKAALRRV